MAVIKCKPGCTCSRHSCPPGCTCSRHPDPDKETLFKVSNKPFREKLEQILRLDDISMGDIARWAGYTCMRRGVERPDTTYLKRDLGLVPTSENNYRELIPYDRAIKLADAMNLDYTEAGV